MLRTLATILALTAFRLTAATAAPTPGSDDPQATFSQRLAPCTSCHGRQGQAASGGYLPRIAGKPAAYLYNQLENFRSGRRNHAAMQAMVTPLADDYLHEIARYFAAIDLPYPPPLPPTSDAAALARGEQLVHQGDTREKIPACTECHGATLTGRQPAIPGLAGLPRDYLAAQLGAWRLGQRRAAAPDCMGEIARQLSASDVSAVSAWLATQKAPEHAHALPQADVRLPLQCGSQMTGAQSGGGARAGDGTAPLSTGATEETLQARGAYLARAGNCMSCHTRRGGAAYAGGRAIATPFGTVYSSNLTPDTMHGLGRWTTDDFWRAMHEGRSRDGHALNPAFPYPYFTLVTRSDTDALFAWLRTLPASPDVAPAHELRFPYNSGLALATWRALYFRPGEFRSTPGRSSAWNRGAYLVRGLGHCGACHTPRDALGGPHDDQELSGGLMVAQGWYAPTLHPLQAGVDDQDVGALLASGVGATHAAGGPMAEVVAGSTRFLAEADLRAVTSFLANLEPDAGAAGSKLGRGHELYRARCAECHGAGGEGVAGRYPALAGSRSMSQGTAANAIQSVLNGGFPPSTALNPQPFGMPVFRQSLNNAEIAAVVSYIRSSWGNGGSSVSAEEVDHLR